jgi:ATP-binding cassette subfamily B protein
LFLGNLFQFLELKPTIVSPSDPVPAPQALQSGIRFNNVIFRYPGSGRLALRNFNLRVDAGQVVAVVGPNGAGKSTLIKLLCRLYDPNEGSVELDGTDLRRFGLEELRSRIAVLFQEPIHYATSAAENIAYGDLKNKPELIAIERAAREAGAGEVIERLPHAYETLLGNWFAGGLELSVGEWQRISLARAFLRGAPIILLDEPTSAMDSWAEVDWMKRFRKLVQGRTALIITHRFSTAMQADRIHVMREGQIVESGCHAELVSNGGLYAQSWAAQTQSIRDS